ncbi:hypothetical protein [Burkholderia ubonensis]|uniref:hypothetical protein n=1 Tax=Burkholderia ubonensis TaxID=101571 RepID=UPI000B32276A|nr:hypothetical protein [Burkholderia ubonensis]
MLNVLSEYVQGQSIAVGYRAIRKLLIKLWNMALLRGHIAGLFQRFGHGCTMIPPPEHEMRTESARIACATAFAYSSSGPSPRRIPRARTHIWRFQVAKRVASATRRGFGNGVARLYESFVGSSINRFFGVCDTPRLNDEKATEDRVGAVCIGATSGRL